jgi:hypothetical protein
MTSRRSWDKQSSLLWKKAQGGAISVNLQFLRVIELFNEFNHPMSI